MRHSRHRGTEHASGLAGSPSIAITRLATPLQVLQNEVAHMTSYYDAWLWCRRAAPCRLTPSRAACHVADTPTRLAHPAICNKQIAEAVREVKR